MTKTLRLFARNFFKNSDGKIVIWQTPNFTLISWLALRLIALPLHDGAIKAGLSHLSTAFLFVWAYLEITKGDSYFRRFLGLLILVLTAISFFR